MNLDYVAEGSKVWGVTNRLVGEALRDWLAANEPAALSGVRWVVEDETAVKSWPLGIVEVTGAQEHEVKDNVWTFAVEVNLETQPKDTDEVAAAVMKDALSEVLADAESLTLGLDNTAELQCWRAQMIAPLTTVHDGRRRDGFALEVEAAAQV